MTWCDYYTTPGWSKLSISARKAILKRYNIVEAAIADPPKGCGPRTVEELKRFLRRLPRVPGI